MILNVPKYIYKREELLNNLYASCLSKKRFNKIKKKAKKEAIKNPLCYEIILEYYLQKEYYVKSIINNFYKREVM